ncbi:MAG: hypothetical protein AAGJ83_10005, partial [Planctomycetota bacterium]
MMLIVMHGVPSKGLSQEPQGPDDQREQQADPAEAGEKPQGVVVLPANGKNLLGDQLRVVNGVQRTSSCVRLAEAMINLTTQHQIESNALLQNYREHTLKLQAMVKEQKELPDNRNIALGKIAE